MKGDFSRIRFDPNKHYTAVLEQQGRVALDADTNERGSIERYLRETQNIDVIGRYGGPCHEAGFKISLDRGRLRIGAGRYYVNGLLCASPVSVAYDEQRYALQARPTDLDLLDELIEQGAGGALIPMTTPTVNTGKTPCAIAIDPWGRYVYVANRDAGTISAFTIGTSGALTPMAVASVKVTEGLTSITVDPSGQYLYVTATGKGNIWQYTIGAGGALAPMNPATLQTGEAPVSAVVDPSGRYLYVACQVGTVWQYTIGPGGLLIPMDPGSLGAGARPQCVAVDAAGHLYVANAVTAGVVTQFALGEGGTLSPLSPPNIATGKISWALALDPAGRYAYVANEGTATVAQFSIATTGALSATAFAPIASGKDPRFVSVDPSGRYVYVVNYEGNTISQYLVGAEGALTPMTAPTVATGRLPTCIAIDPSGRYAYVANYEDGTVSQYTLAPAGLIGLYLEVWQRLVTALDDPDLGEPALGQGDTTARAQTVWRVIASFQPGADINPEATCCKQVTPVPIPRHTGSLQAYTSPDTGDCGCQPIPSAGYRGLENQLYRVEIHQGGTESTATFKWSRENGSVVVAITQVDNARTVTVSSLGPDANLGFQVGQCVEISDDNDLFGSTPMKPGTLCTIEDIQPESLTVKLSTPVSVDTRRNARMRRWDQAVTAGSSPDIALSTGAIPLENGIEVNFGPGNYVSGDAWTIPARAATAQIDWPQLSGGRPAAAPAHYQPLYRAPLACIHVQGTHDSLDGPCDSQLVTFNGIRLRLDDCRSLFQPLSELCPPNRASALHITGINWDNDAVMTLDELIDQGLIASFDRAPTGPITPANFIVTLETANRSEEFQQTVLASSTLATRSAPAAAPTTPAATPSAPAAAPAAGNAASPSLNPAIDDESPPTTLRAVTLVESRLTQQGQDVIWSLPDVESNLTSLIAIDYALRLSQDSGRLGRMRVKLPGRALYAEGTATDARKTLYLDGQAFGRTVPDTDVPGTKVLDTGALSADSRNRIEFEFPTGDDARASDFESWFYLYPALQVQEIDFAYYALLLVPTGNSVEVFPSPLPPPPYTQVQQQATITLNYAPTVATPVTLLLSDTTVASAPATVQVPAGQTTVQVPITFNVAPSSGAIESIQLTASLASLLGSELSQTNSFTVAAAFTGIEFEIVTGTDELPVESSATATLEDANGNSLQVIPLKSAKDPAWIHKSTHTVNATLSAPRVPSSIAHIVIAPGGRPTSWSIMSVTASLSNGATTTRALASASGTSRKPLITLTADEPNYTLMVNAT